ncbi:hypothetical protein JCM33374_g5795 [Metschnikowia sp. JCM 33374]|nr:hypothetical protein JCM33374_g5795 [Metschnikowia sp. JCM 33374]
MDSFETSSQFVQILKGLVPQAQSLLKAAHFALKNSESEDYLYYAIIDILEDSKIELNTKSTIFQFIDVLIHESFHASQQAHTNYNYPYVHNLKNSLPKILIQVLPSNSNANLFNIYDNLKNISEALNVNYSEFESKFLAVETSLTSEELENVNMNIPYPEIRLDEMDMQSQDPVLQAWQILLKKRQQSHYERLRLLENEPFKDGEITEDDMFLIRTSRQDPSKKVNENLLSKKQILARMEDDRETHKKSKESLWLVNRPSGSNTITEDEFVNYYWNRLDKVSEIQAGEFFGAFDELNKLAGASYKDPQF